MIKTKKTINSLIISSNKTSTNHICCLRFFLEGLPRPARPGPEQPSPKLSPEDAFGRAQISSPNGAGRGHTKQGEEAPPAPSKKKLHPAVLFELPCPAGLAQSNLPQSSAQRISSPALRYDGPKELGADTPGRARKPRQKKLPPAKVVSFAEGGGGVPALPAQPRAACAQAQTRGFLRQDTDFLPQRS